MISSEEDDYKIIHDLKVGILKNEDADSIDYWIAACEKRNVEYSVIDLTSENWLEKVKEDEYDFFLLRPPGNIQEFKTMYDERIFIISNVLQKRVFPSFLECYLYENKKLQNYFLRAHNIPHPETLIFYDYNQAMEFIHNCDYPIVAKTSIGAAGSGVEIIRNQKHAKKYIYKAFKGSGIRRRFGPNRVTGSPKKWFIKAIQDPKYFKTKLQSYVTKHKHSQNDFVIFQKYISHEYEWRVIKIGESYFAHKKLVHNGKASGVKAKEFVDPPKNLLNYVKNICDQHNFQSMSVDIFEVNKGEYLINELQTIIGHAPDPVTGSFYRMAVNGKPGRYVFKNSEWIFEEGDFNTNKSYDLRLQTVIDLHNNANRAE